MRVTTLLAWGPAPRCSRSGPRRRPRPAAAGTPMASASIRPSSRRSGVARGFTATIRAPGITGSRGYYPYYGSGYWVPRAEMRYRYRYKYVGPKYRYFPAWGYDGCLGTVVLLLTRRPSSNVDRSHGAGGPACAAASILSARDRLRRPDHGHA